MLSCRCCSLLVAVLSQASTVECNKIAIEIELLLCIAPHKSVIIDFVFQLQHQMDLLFAPCQTRITPFSARFNDFTRNKNYTKLYDTHTHTKNALIYATVAAGDMFLLCALQSTVNNAEHTKSGAHTKLNKHSNSHFTRKKRRNHSELDTLNYYLVEIRWQRINFNHFKSLR